MSWSQRNGLKKLQKRKKDGDIIVLTTDKSNKFAVTDVESYLAMGAVHTDKDREIGEDEVRRIQRLHNGHTAMLAKITNLGQNWKHEDRIRESCIQHTCTVPPMYLLVKDHKEVKEGALPATRPVVSGTSGMGLSMSNILSDIVENIANMRPDPIEVISTEDLLSRIDSYNENIAKNGPDDVVLTGADAVQLFPSLRAAESGKIVREATINIIKETGLEVEGLDFKEIAKYIRMNFTDKEISVRGLSRVVPVRRYTKGCMPGMTGEEALKKVEEGEERFLYPQIQLTKEEEINMFATALEIAVKFMFTHHVYSFGGKIFRQTDSGPIGLRITMAVARLVMGEWGKKMRNILTEADIKLYMESLYVDDARYLTSALKEGVRWSQEEKKFVYRAEWEHEERLLNVNKHHKTSEELCKAMNSIYPNIQFTFETESDFPNNRLPSLDCELWMEEGKYLRYSFFEKSMKNPFCIMQSSAMSNKSKVQILSQDLVRRMMNICDTVSQSERNRVVDNYTDRLIRSGYSFPQVYDIIVSGLTGYERKLKRAANENTPIHRPAASTLKNRIHKKLIQKEIWYKEKKKHNDDMKKNNHKKEDDKVKTPVVSIMFVPHTPQSQLHRKLKKVEAKISDLTGDKIQHVERAGTKLRFLLVTSDPWSNVKCGREKCLVCSNPYNKDFSCRKRNVSYKTYCLKCAADAGADEKTLRVNINDNIKFYFGETFRDAYSRGVEHLSDYVGQTDDSHMMKHLSDCHPDSRPEEIKFGMSVIKQHRSSFDRMVFESVLIFRDGENVLNSKSEFSRCQVPRLSVMIGDNQKYDNVEKDKEVAKLKRRLIDDNHNCKPPKRRRKHKHVDWEDAFETKKDDLEAIEISETSQKAVDEHQSDVAQDATKIATSYKAFLGNWTHKYEHYLLQQL